VPDLSKLHLSEGVGGNYMEDKMNSSKVALLQQ